MKNSFFLIAFFLLSSCTSTKMPSLNEVYVTDEKSVQILSPGCLMQDIEKRYVFEAEFDGHKISCEVFAKASKSGIYMTMMNEFGSTVAELSYDGARCEVSSSVLPKKIKPEYIMLDFQNAFYDMVALNETYVSSGLAFWAMNRSGGENQKPAQFRCIYDGEKLVEKIMIEEKFIKIKNYVRNYLYTLKEVDE